MGMGWRTQSAIMMLVAIACLARDQRLDVVAMQRRDRTWATGRSTEEAGVSFDSDDVGSRGTASMSPPRPAL